MLRARSQNRSDLAVIGEGLQCSLRDRFHCKWSDQRLDVESIGRHFEGKIQLLVVITALSSCPLPLGH